MFRPNHTTSQPIAIKQHEFIFSPGLTAYSNNSNNFHVSQQNWKGISSSKFGYAQRVHFPPRDMLQGLLGNDPVFLGRRHLTSKESGTWEEKATLRTFPEIHNKPSVLNDDGKKISNRAYVPATKKLSSKLILNGTVTTRNISTAKSLVRPNTFQGMRPVNRAQTPADMRVEHRGENANKTIRVVTKAEWNDREKAGELDDEIKNVKSLHMWERTYLREANREKKRNASETSRPETMGSLSSARRDLAALGGGNRF